VLCTLSYLRYDDCVEDQCDTMLCHDIIGKYLLKLQEMTIDGEDSSIDMYKIGEDIGLVDTIQSDHIVQILLKDGCIRSDKENYSKIKLTDEGYKRMRNIRHSELITT
jgi:hypothetical protein